MKSVSLTSNLRATVCAVATLLFLTGCATTPQPSYDLMALEQQRLQRLDQVALTCTSDLCRVMVAQEQGRNQYRPAPQGHHPAWSILDRTIALAVPAYFGARQIADLAGLTESVAGTIASMDGSNNSITVSGNYGDTDNSQTIGGNLGDTDQSQTIGGNYGDTRGDEYGSFVGGDQRTGDDRIGDEYDAGNDIRITSPGPIDESDNSDSSDNSVTNPPLAP